MKITRTIHGETVEIELTLAERREAFEEQSAEYRLEDVRSHFSGENFTEEEIGKIADRFERNLDHCDTWYDAYWTCLELTADEVVGF